MSGHASNMADLTKTELTVKDFVERAQLPARCPDRCDAASNSSNHSRRSHASSRSSVHSKLSIIRLEEQQKQAELVAKQKMLTQRRQLEQRRQELEWEEQQLELNMEMDISKAKMIALARFEDAEQLEDKHVPSRTEPQAALMEPTIEEGKPAAGPASEAIRESDQESQKQGIQDSTGTQSGFWIPKGPIRLTRLQMPVPF